MLFRRVCRRRYHHVTVVDVVVDVVVVVVSVAVAVSVVVVVIVAVIVVVVTDVMVLPHTSTSDAVASAHEAWGATTNTAPALGADAGHTHALRMACEFSAAAP